MLKGIVMTAQSADTATQPRTVDMVHILANRGQHRQQRQLGKAATLFSMLRMNILMHTRA